MFLQFYRYDNSHDKSYLVFDYSAGNQVFCHRNLLTQQRSLATLGIARPIEIILFSLELAEMGEGKGSFIRPPIATS